MSARRCSTGENVASHIDILPVPSPEHQPRPEPSTTTPKTIKYLAYGSNLCAKTFLGRRGIRPLAQINVIAPDLRLVFDLPGIPYWEPRFANVQWRKRNPDELEEDGESYVRQYIADPSSFSSLLPADDDEKNHTVKGLHDRPLIGVVYEVTPEDYYHIIATEGGYDQVSVRCYALPAPPGEEENVSSSTTTNETTFDAMTLLAPTRITRPDHFGQASARYLGLITTGAGEHSLPESYREYLASLQPYEKTERRQVIGGFLFAAAWGPVFMTMLGLRRLFSGKDGKAPDWILRYMNIVMRSAWWSYDGAWRPVWGNGEETHKKKDENNNNNNKEMNRKEGEKQTLINRDEKGYGSASAV